MRFRRRYAILAFASVAALAVGGTAHAVTNNVSTIPVWNVTPSALPGAGTGGSGTGTLAPVQLDIRVHTDFLHPGIKTQGGYVKQVQLLFDDDVKLNLAGVPNCTATFSGGTTIAAAWNTCGPGAGAAHNAYLSPPTAVSGLSSTAPASNFGGCTLVFKKSATQVILFARVTTSPNSVPNCSSPATNNTGNATVAPIGTLSTVSIAEGGGRPASEKYTTKLNVPGVDQLPLPLDDFSARLKRGSVLSARCKDANNTLGLRSTWVYSGTGQTPDTVTKQKACT